MQTVRWEIHDDKTQYKDAISEAAKLLRDGETVAFPTETVYGLGADATNADAVDKIFAAKGRPQDNPLIAHVGSKAQLKKLVQHIPEYVEQLMDTFSPGPITYVLYSNGTCSDKVTAGQDTIGVRIPDHPIALELLQTCNIPIAAPSANISGRPSPTTANHVWDDLQGKIAGLLDGGPTGVGVESTVIDCTQEIPIILRPGGISKEQLEEVVGEVKTDPALVNDQLKPKAPGMKYKHYTPDVPLWLVDGSDEAIQLLIDKERGKNKRVAFFARDARCHGMTADDIVPLGENVGQVATRLYDALRKYHASEMDLIICEAFAKEGIGDAVMNRLEKAASQFLTDIPNE
ncbi:L-threonylcarbamoyladenylate synthase [Virgibacillus soli]|uniref:Threonylcarbamoyl-AMP synthase n=1 Tax=Paracerasibacillus soli TaxID=480284 RepID=A0ABU5CT08_9BACI|nr:L-threonylcarbamoyladenylate synthase [Virgibacillus soli]MDY0409500.1 L-threonylcarbamoyladenylate synthase [Virgibacillus soli]